jgi:hypothetical protein
MKGWIIFGLIVLLIAYVYYYPNSTVSKTLSAIPYLNIITQIGQTVNSFTTPIDNNWATQFFNNVSSVRGSSYSYCSSLSSFAQLRFNTMVANYGITHYGHDQDFNKFFGTIYNTYFAEEVFHPDGYSPSNFVSNIQQTAAAHWQLLSSSNYDYYGYYIAKGSDYAINQPCSVSELPGPNIDIQQYFAQYGCTTTTTTDTWFVIELSSGCP